MGAAGQWNRAAAVGESGGGADGTGTARGSRADRSRPSAGRLVHLGEGCDVRPVLSTLRSATDGRPPVIQLWARPRGVAPDALFALLCGDLSAPVTFAVDRTGWAPTVALTAYLRALPADGWLRVLCTCVEIGQDWFDEDHIVVDRLGRIVVQTRQLAMVPAQ